MFMRKEYTWKFTVNPTNEKQLLKCESEMKNIITILVHDYTVFIYDLYYFL